MILSPPRRHKLSIDQFWITFDFRQSTKVISQKQQNDLLSRHSLNLIKHSVPPPIHFYFSSCTPMGGESGGGPRLNSFNIVPLIMYTCTIDIGKMALTLALLNITVDWQNKITDVSPDSSCRTHRSGLSGE